MNKLVFLGILPSLVGLNSFNVRQNSNTVTYNVMENGDYSLSGYGSVTDELEKSGKFNLDDYKLGKKNNNQLLFVSESDESMYLYAYFVNPDDLFRYDKVSMKIWDAEAGETLADYNDSTDGVWADLNLTPVSFDETKTLCKYKIEDLYVNNDVDHMYIFREIYDESNKNSYDYILKAGLIYNYSSSRDFISVVNEETVSIKNKLVGYQLMPYTFSEGNQGLFQRSFVGFSIEDTPNGENIEDLVDVTLSYDATYYGGYTDIPLNYKLEGSFGFEWNKALDIDEKVGQYDLYRHMDKSVLYKEYEEQVVKTISHEPIKVSYSEHDNSWFGIQYNEVNFSNSGDDLTYDAIESIDSIDDEILNRNTNLKNCDWFVSFDNREIGCGAYFNGFDIGVYKTIYSIGNIFAGVTLKDEISPTTSESVITHDLAVKDFSFGNKNNEYDNMLLHAEDVSILKLTYVNDLGVERNVLAIDSYNDSVGQVEIKDDSTSSDWDNFVNNIQERFNDLGNGIANSWNVIKWVLFGVFSFVFVIFIVYLIKFLSSLFSSNKVKIKLDNDYKRKKKK